MQEKSVKHTEISERISQVIEYLKTTPNNFAKKLGYERGQTIYDILNGKSAPSFDFFNRLYCSEYSEMINPIWLLTGKGRLTDEINSNSTYDILTTRCEVCLQKDQTISALKDVNTVLRDSIELYKTTLEANRVVDGKNSISKQSVSG